MIIEFKKNFGLRVKHYRELLGYTQEVLAEKIGIVPNTLSYIERGKNAISFTRLPILCAALEIKSYQLFIDNENSNADKIQKIDNFLVLATDKQLGILFNLAKSIIDL